MDLQNITLISFGYFEEDFLEKVAEAVKQEFHLSVNIKEGHMDLSEFYDPGTEAIQWEQTAEGSRFYFSHPILIKTIGLFNVDLFIPILTYIFGQAFLNGRYRNCIYSTG